MVGKGNAISVNKSVMVHSFEMYMDIPGVETLTFYVYQHDVATKQSFKLVKSWNVKVNGTGLGSKWYSSGFNATYLLCGNSYILGVSWPGMNKYYFDVKACTQEKLPFGTWLSGSTVAHPLPPRESVWCDGAMYYQRITTTALSTVNCVGTGCSTSGPAPRLLASTAPVIGTTLKIDVAFGALPTPTAFLLSPTRALTNPIPLFGCSIWLDLRLPVLTFVIPVNGSGEVTLNIPIPLNPNLRGTRFAVQAGVLRPNLDITNALDLTLF
jgi:hypothetical protein